MSLVDSVLERGWRDDWIIHNCKVTCLDWVRATSDDRTLLPRAAGRLKKRLLRDSRPQPPRIVALTRMPRERPNRRLRGKRRRPPRRGSSLASPYRNSGARSARGSTTPESTQPTTCLESDTHPTKIRNPTSCAGIYSCMGVGSRSICRQRELVTCAATRRRPAHIVINLSKSSTRPWVQGLRNHALCDDGFGLGHESMRSGLLRKPMALRPER